MNKTIGAVSAIVGVVLVGALVFLIMQNSNLNSDLGELRSELEAPKPTPTEEGPNLAQRIEELETKLKGIQDCLPEVQDQLNSLEVDFEYGFVTANPPSRFCTEVLYGEVPTGD